MTPLDTPGPSHEAFDVEQRYTDEAMREVRVWWARGALCVLTFIPATILTYWLTRSENAAIAVGGVWMVSFLVCGFCLGVVSCPRCKGLLFVGKHSVNLLTDVCVHCGLSLRTTKRNRQG